MSRAATRATVALLCGVVLVALGLAFIGMPESEVAPEPLAVALDFDTFQPGVTQTRTSVVDIPVPSQVTEARIEASGSDVAIATNLTICQFDQCQPLVTGTDLDAGSYTLTVEATLDADVAPGSSGALAGEISIVESRQSTMVDTTLLMTVAGIGLLAIAVGVLTLGRRQGVAT